jgi:putrescine transport system permease protein
LSRVLVRAQLAGFDRALEEAALDLGARPLTVLWRITLPGISPALVSGWLLAFTLSLDDLVVASFVSGPSATTLPMAVYSSVRIGVTPEVNALATVFLAVVCVMVTLAGWLMARQERRRLAASVTGRGSDPVQRQEFVPFAGPVAQQIASAPQHPE